MIGSGQGPWISTQGLAEPRAKVTGMKDGGELIVTVCNADNPVQETSMFRIIKENGVYELKEGRWMQVHCHNGGRNVICDILTKKAVA